MNNLEKERRQAREWNRKNKISRKDNDLKKLYGISIEDYNQMFVNQNGVCAICERQQVTGKSLSVDHDHNTGKVRGLLCNKCNTSLGMLDDNIDYLLNAIAYLKLHS